MVPNAIMAYPATKYSSTGLTLNMMLFGQKITEPINLIASLPLGDYSATTLPQHVMRLRECLESSHERAQETWRKSVERAK